jgi:RNA 2',3'-cyclic 3'-phosphodiesterase
VTSTTRRLFVAVDPPRSAREHLQRSVAPLRDAPGAPRWAAPERWHLTLLFLGAVPEERVGPLTAAAGTVVSGASAMELRLAGAGRFGSVRRPQVFWAGLDGDVPALVELAARLADAARDLGLPIEDRTFRPHLTLGRWPPRRPADGTLPELLAGYVGPAWPVTEVRLVESHLGGKATRHEVLAAFPIG